jgi:hypothetical protein
MTRGFSFRGTSASGGEWFGVASSRRRPHGVPWMVPSGFSSFPSFLEPAVHLEDVLVRGAFGGHVWVVPPAQDVGGALKGVMPNPPTSFGMAIDLPDSGIHAQRDCRNQRRLTKVGPKARPEVVIEVRTAVKGSGVQRDPVSNSIEEADQ